MRKSQFWGHTGVCSSMHGPYINIYKPLKLRPVEHTKTNVAASFHILSTLKDPTELLWNHQI